MSEKPILFSPSMVRAILDDRKTQTRRTVTAAQWRNAACADHAQHVTRAPDGNWQYADMDGYHDMRAPEPRYQPGDVLWVREKTRECLIGSESMTEYVADGWAPRIRWNYSRNTRPSIHLPRKLARLFLRVTSVRVERLREISYEDALAEGVNDHTAWIDDLEPHAPTGETVAETARRLQWPQRAFEQLWDSLNAKRGFGWETNCWVWVIEFERIGAARDEGKG